MLESEVRTGEIKIHAPEDFEGMRRAGRLAAECLDMLAPHVVPGVSTETLDRLAREFTLDHGALPACLYYRGYSHTLCISPNHVVCHGIPGERTLREGDIANIDVTVIVDGWHGDTSRMFGVGEVSPRARRLVETTYEALDLGLAAGEARRAAWATSATPSRPMSRPSAAAWCATSAATAWAGVPRRAQCAALRPPAEPGRCCGLGCSSPSSRW